jgi:hypothetical protein
MNLFQNLVFKIFFKKNQMNKHYKVAPLKGFRTVTKKLQQVRILLGKHPKPECFLNNPTASSPESTASDYPAPEYATFFLTDGFASESN